MAALTPGSVSRPPLRCGDRTLAIGSRTFVMGILNVTPDSFSDGGSYVDVDSAVAAACALVDDGADIVDVGGESTRPGAVAVSVDEERRRVLPVIEALQKRGIRNISIDTRHAAVARDALAAGAAWVNDVSALDDEGMKDAAAAADAVVLMHWRKAPHDAREDKAVYADVVDDVHAFLAERVRRSGLAPERLVVDPGVGFGKTVDDNLRLLKGGRRFHDLGAVLLGASRKRFLGALSGRDVPRDRDAASVGAACVAAAGGADIVRVHAVKATVDALKIVDAARSC